MKRGAQAASLQRRAACSSHCDYLIEIAGARDADCSASCRAGQASSLRSPEHRETVEERIYFFIKSSTAAVIATTPVRMVGSGTGANLLECRVGSGAAPGFFDSANFAGSTAPT